MEKEVDNCLPPMFWAVGKLSENLLAVKSLFKNAKFKAENPHFGEIQREN